MSEIKLADLGEEQSPRERSRTSPLQLSQRVGKMPYNLLASSWRLATSVVRHLPTTVILGTDEAATELLFHKMLKHPRCYGAAEAGLEYFSRPAKRPMAWYRAQFPWRRRVWRRQGHVLEASTSYLSSPAALRKMHSVLPNARTVVLLSDPVERAFADYQRAKARGVESRRFAEVVEQEIRANEFAAGWGVGLREGAKPMSGCVSRGYYALQLEVLNKTYRRNRILVLEAASLFADAVATCNRVFDYMGLDDCDVEACDAAESGSRQIADPRVVSMLREHYRPYDELLAEFLEKPCSWMQPSLRVAAA